LGGALEYKYNLQYMCLPGDTKIAFSVGYFIDKKCPLKLYVNIMKKGSLGVD